MKSSIGIFLVSFFLLFISNSSLSYTYWQCNDSAYIWPNKRYDLTISQSLPSSIRSAITTVVNNINADAANATVILHTTGNSSPRHGDGRNQIYFSSQGVGRLAYAKIYRKACNSSTGSNTHVIESDVVFNSSYQWLMHSQRSVRSWFPDDFDDYKEDPTIHPVMLQHVATHEILHALGLAHDNNGVAIMSAKYPGAGGQGGAVTMFRDDRRGLRHIYGINDEGHFDIGAVAMRTETDDGSNDSSPKSKLFNGYDPITVTQGQSISLKFGVENLGLYSPSDVQVHWYLSTNDIISRSDYVLPVSTRYAKLDTWSHHSVNNRIPTDIPKGEYYLGFLIDRYNSIREYNENNNAIVVRKVIVQ